MNQAGHAAPALPRSALAALGSLLVLAFALSLLPSAGQAGATRPRTPAASAPAHRDVVLRVGDRLLVRADSIASALGAKWRFDATRDTGTLWRDQSALAFVVDGSWAFGRDPVFSGDAVFELRAPMTREGAVLYLPLRDTAEFFDATLTLGRRDTVTVHAKGAPPTTFAVTPRPFPQPSSRGAHPVIAASDGALLGGSLGGAWVGSERMMGSLRGGEVYRLYSLTGSLGTARGSRPSVTELGTDIAVDLESPPSAADVIGLSGAWNALPRVPQVEAGGAASYGKVVDGCLRSHGLKAQATHVTQAIRCDVDGDGTRELLLTGTSPGLVSSAAGKGEDTLRGPQYSLVIIQDSHAGKRTTRVIKALFVPEGLVLHEPLPAYRIAGLLDIDNDGLQEIAVKAQFCYGRYWSFHKVTPQQTYELFTGYFGT